MLDADISYTYCCKVKATGIDITSIFDDTPVHTYTTENDFLDDFGLRTGTTVNQNWNGTCYILFLGGDWITYEVTISQNPTVKTEAAELSSIFLKPYSIVLNFFSTLNEIQNINSQHGDLNVQLAAAFDDYLVNP